MKGLSEKAASSIERLVENKFDSIAMRILGFVPKPTKDKKIVFKTSRDNLISLFLQALGTREPNRLEEQTLKVLLSVANGYMDGLKQRTASRIIHDVDSYVRDQNIQNKKVSSSKINKIINDQFKKSKNHLEMIASTESNKAVNFGTALQISKLAKQKKEEDPTVYFVVTIDDVTGPEEFVLHLLPDKKTPRVWKLSELGSGYHKKGDPKPKLAGLHPNCRCFTDKYAPVITEKGTKPLCKVQVGDRVLTHTGKFKKVLGTFGEDGVEFNEPLYRIEFVDPKGKIRKLRATADHLMLTNNGWKRVDNLKREDKLKWLYKKCEQCGKSIPHDIEKDSKRFCSKACVGKSRVGKSGYCKGIRWSKEVVEKRKKSIAKTKLAKQQKKLTSQTFTCKHCAKKFTKNIWYKNKQGRIVYRKPFVFCSRSCASKNITSKQWSDINHRKNVSRKNSQSMIEQYKSGERDRYNIVEKARKQLYKNGRVSKDQNKLFKHILHIYPDAEMEVKVDKYYVDIAIPSLQTIVEWDGGGHWMSVYKGEKTMEEKLKEDRDRDERLNSLGWHVLRYNEDTGFKNVYKDIRRVAMNSQGEYSFENVEIKDIVFIPKTKVSKKARLFDLTVEDDESFVILGVISHNCKLTYLAEGWGFDKSGNVKFISPDHNEFKAQREKHGLPR